MKQYIYASTNKDIADLELENRHIAYEAATESIVLLKNDGCLPLKEESIALFGSGAKKTIKGGTGSGEVNERYSVSIYSGLLNKGFKITSNKWLDDYDIEYKEAWDLFNSIKFNPFTILKDASEHFSYPFGRLIEESDVDAETDVAIYVASRQAGEGKDKRLDNGDYNLVEGEVKNLEFLKAHYQKVILVINSGSGMDLSNIDHLGLNAIVYVNGLGEEGGNAFASILKGEVSPSARLASTWPMSYNDIPYGNEYSYLNGILDKEYYKEDIYVGYRYFDTFKVKPRFSFGHGLSYSSFSYAYSNLHVDKSIISFDCIVTNIGQAKAKEVVFVFLSMPNGKLKKEYRRLITFKKTKELEIGESEKLSFHFDLKEASSFDEEMASFILEKGLYLIWAGPSLDASKIIYGIDLNQTYYVNRLANLVKLEDDFERLTPSFDNHYDLPANLQIGKVLDLEEVEVKYDVPKYEYSEDVNKIASNLTINDKVNLVVGMGIKGMVDSCGIYTPGTVGKTTTKLFKKGIINLNLCDGPAGLRILRESALSKSGKQKMYMGHFPVGIMNHLPKWIVFPYLAKEHHQKLYQFATAFPVGTSLAQTFNEDLCYKIGCAISKEMERYGVSYFLGPALNIHRNPLCGRNFEYYSEDPYVSGKIAKSIVKGIESIPGHYSTVKHFACNNTEDNRQHSNSIVSERALREIYLKGFEICIKEGKPDGLMSSYNLINGEYAGNRYDLNTSILRCEWGYTGIVMTDWFETGKSRASNAVAIASGVDLIMPGDKYAKKEIKKGLKNGSLSINDLDRSSQLIIKQMLESKTYQDWRAKND